MRVLLIEDDKLIGEGLKLGLTKQQFVVDWFEDGKQGFEALFTTDYDAVVLDLTLPKMDGMNVLKKWRKENQDTPVLILTARDTLDDGSRCQITGVSSSPLSAKQYEFND